MIHDYKLNNDLTLKRNATKIPKDTITFSFRDILLQHDNGNSHQEKLIQSVQIASTDIGFEVFVPAKSKVKAIIISLKIDDLKTLLDHNDGKELLENIILQDKPYIYEESFSAQIKNIKEEIMSANMPQQLSNFYFKIKAQELIYLFFVELLKRKSITQYPINASDAKIIYQIRDRLILDLSLAPNITELCLLYGMSETKMQRLFKQVFGNTIHNYHQKNRIKEAANLIKNKKVSVSEAGYLIGFTNMSHFSRIFERHTGLKPKKYSAMVLASNKMAQ